MTAADLPLLDVRGLVAPAEGRRLLHRGGPVLRPEGVSLQVGRGETYGVVGESGSGASAMARAIVQAGNTAGRVLLDGVEVAELDPVQRRRRLRLLGSAGDGRRQPWSSLVDDMRAAGIADPESRVPELADAVELPATVLHRPESELPDGQRRRVAVARAVCTGPDLVVADDPTAGLDVTVAAQLLDLLGRLKAALGLTYLLVARDLGVVRHLSDRVGVMYLGAVVEEAPARALYRGPWHPYTRALLSAVPVPDPEVEDRRERILLVGDPPTATPGGCAFHPRCPWIRPGRCQDEGPLLRALPGAAPGHVVACHHAEDLDGAVAANEPGAAAENPGH
ncbi:MAG: peptide/nickel transport system ATP-binding protein [Pseudonocardiales bacterium]|nr:peptide/nickel transport system ATP-binding protein [Pseudonocardiales bacterium]